MKYIDGFVAAVPSNRQKECLEQARLAAVVFSWVAWPSRAQRDEGMKRFMQDPRVKDMKMPFDGQRMIYGGFEVILDA